jgi:pentatricopeptide repeat protein
MKSINGVVLFFVALVEFAGVVSAFLSLRHATASRLASFGPSSSGGASLTITTPSPTSCTSLNAIEKTTSWTQRKAPSRKHQLRWILQSIQKEKQTQNDPLTVDSARFEEALEELANARTPEQVTKAGSFLQSLPIAETESFPVQERLVKALALSGLVTFAVNMTEAMLDAGYFPSEITQDAICNSLRKTSKIMKLSSVVHRLGQVATAQSTSATGISVVSFNIYLAALCDNSSATISTKEKSSSSQRRVSKNSNSRTSNTNLLDTACEWLLEPDKARRELGVVPDAISYATVLHAAASQGNWIMADVVWNGMIHQGLIPTIYAYNARLKIVASRGLDRDAQALQIWQDIRNDPRLVPDRYTIDLILLPLIRAGKIGEVESLLDRFVSSNSGVVVSNAFGAFLGTIVQGGEVASASALFSIYILPALASVVSGDAVSRLVKPTTRHFNILIDGYRQLATAGFNNSTSTQVESEDDDSTMTTLEGKDEFVQEGWDLYRLMVKSPALQPDPYTITSMMGLCQSPAELSDLLGQAVNDFGIECSSVVLRATLTAYGALSDPSSACWVFVKYMPSSRGARDWNVLAGALAKGAAIDSSTQLDIHSADAARTLTRDKFDASQHVLVQLLNGRSSCDAVKTLLDLMSGHLDSGGLPVPASDSQTYCIAASALQYGPSNPDQAISIFHNATVAGISADGRFINAVLRCFGDDITAALTSWKSDIRPACIAYENRARNKATPTNRPKAKNLLAAYNGLLYVCGRALRPDIGLRVVYAMNKEGVEPTEISLNCYRSGKRVRQKDGKSGFSLLQQINLIDPYESLMYVECTKYDLNDRRRSGERRVRIIV